MKGGHNTEEEYYLQNKLCLSFKNDRLMFSSVAQLCLTLCDPVDCSTPVHHQLQEPTQTHVHCVSDAIQPSHPLLMSVLWRDKCFLLHLPTP